jgi:hypothetical protein
LKATPKHFSLCAAIAALPSAFVSGSAKAIVARALDMALARTSEVIVVFADIDSLQVNFSPPSRARTGIFEAAPETLQPAASKFRGIRFAGFLRRLRAAQNIRALL